MDRTTSRESGRVREVSTPLRMTARPLTPPHALRSLQIVEVWCKSYDGVTDSLVGVAKVPLPTRLESAGRWAASSRGPAHRLTETAFSRVDDWLIDESRALVADASIDIVDPLVCTEERYHP